MGSIACGPSSEHISYVFRSGTPNTPYCIKDDGTTVTAEGYQCKKKKPKDTCERGDLSGKLGQLEVKESTNGYPKVVFNGVDEFFPVQHQALTNVDEGTPWSIVISKDGEPFLCAQFNMKCDNK